MKVEEIKGSSHPKAYLDKTNDGQTAGMLEKFEPSPLETHPWKCFLGIGASRQYITACYGNRAEAANIVHIAWKHGITARSQS